jgi:hypothetical protein
MRDSPGDEAGESAPAWRWSAIAERPRQLCLALSLETSDLQNPIRRIVMTTNFARALLVLGGIFVLVLAPLQAQASHCSNASQAGNWAYTYTGTIFTQNGPLPTASVGRFSQDAAGNITGSQTRSVAGNSGVEDISGNVTVNPDCTAGATINVLVNGQLQRTAVLALVYDSNGNHARMIFQSLTLPNGTNVPVVITIDANRLVNRD